MPARRAVEPFAPVDPLRGRRAAREPTGAKALVRLIGHDGMRVA